jgi:hypothetical protein
VSGKLAEEFDEKSYDVNIVIDSMHDNTYFFYDVNLSEEELVFIELKYNNRRPYLILEIRKFTAANGKGIESLEYKLDGERGHFYVRDNDTHHFMGSYMDDIYYPFLYTGILYQDVDYVLSTIY